MHPHGHGFPTSFPRVSSGFPPHAVHGNRDPYIIHLNIALQMVVSLYFGVEKATCFKWLQPYLYMHASIRKWSWISYGFPLGFPRVFHGFCPHTVHGNHPKQSTEANFSPSAKAANRFAWRWVKQGLAPAARRARDACRTQGGAELPKGPKNLWVPT